MVTQHCLLHLLAFNYILKFEYKEFDGTTKSHSTLRLESYFYSVLRFQVIADDIQTSPFNGVPQRKKSG